MFEGYTGALGIEAETLLRMVDTGMVPACARDLAIYRDTPELAGERPEVYKLIRSESERLKSLLKAVPHDIEEEAFYYCNTVKPQMEALRAQCDKAEALIQAD